MTQVLLVVGDWRERALILAQLQEEGYTVHAADTCRRAIALLVRGLISPDVVVVDQVAQDTIEQDLLALCKLIGDAPLVLCTGVYEQAGTQDKLAAAWVLVRPFRVQDVVEAVRDVVGKEH
jgi:DNA-binding NtrC family response regulator